MLPENTHLPETNHPQLNKSVSAELVAKTHKANPTGQNYLPAFVKQFHSAPLTDKPTISLMPFYPLRGFLESKKMKFPDNLSNF